MNITLDVYSYLGTICLCKHLDRLVYLRPFKFAIDVVLQEALAFGGDSPTCPTSTFLGFPELLLLLLHHQPWNHRSTHEP